ncbi:MAG: S41 family peptidase [Oscillospiraceae bacterium]|nr:S41 family peptidase [Oscillospiraceae bacterium]
MNKKISVGVCISLIAIACTVSFVVTWTISLNIYNDMIPVSQQDKMNSKLREIDAFLQNNFLYYNEIDEEKADFGLFSGYISGVGDKNTFYMNAQEYNTHVNLEKGQFVTCGVEVGKEGSDYLTVTDVYPDSSADTSGVMRGDIVTAIDGIEILTIGQDTAVKFLDGEVNTRVELTIQRQGEILKHSLIRQAVEINAVDSVIVDDVGFIRITAFSVLTSAQVESVLRDFAQSEIRALVLDLRAVASDFFEPVPYIIDLLVGENTVAHTEHRGGVRKDYIITDDEKILGDGLTVTVLVDSGTSGAGELIAAALNNFADADIVGMTTAGNFYQKQTQPLKDGSAIRVTVAKIVVAGEIRYADTGINPDYIVEMSPEDYYDFAALSEVTEIDEITDLQILKAFELIGTVDIVIDDTDE